MRQTPLLLGAIQGSKDSQGLCHGRGISHLQREIVGEHIRVPSHLALQQFQNFWLPAMLPRQEIHRLAADFQPWMLQHFPAELIDLRTLRPVESDDPQAIGTASRFLPPVLLLFPICQGRTVVFRGLCG